MGAFPRACGGDPVPSFGQLLFDLLFPARAGVILEKEEYRTMLEPFPRACGGDPGGQPRPAGGVGFSPRVRG